MAQLRDISEETAAPEIDPNAPPEGFEQASGDLAGYWETASPPTRNSDEKLGSDPIRFTPLWVTLSDSDLDARKTSTLLHARLVKPAVLRSADKSEGYREFGEGTLFGIWTKPGMKPLQNLCGAEVWMRNGQTQGKEIVYFKEIGKPSPMVLFDIRHKGSGTKLPVREDRRDKSLPDALKEKRAQVAQDLGDIPF